MSQENKFMHTHQGNLCQLAYDFNGSKPWFCSSGLIILSRNCSLKVKADPYASRKL